MSKIAGARSRGRKTLRIVQPAGMTGAELAAQAGITKRRLRYFIEAGLLARAEFRSRATRYTREHLWRLALIERYRREGLGMKAIAERLNSLSPHDVETLGSKLLPASLPVPDQSSGNGDGRTVQLTDLPSGQPWKRLQLSDQIELWFRSDTEPMVVEQVSQLRAQFIALNTTK